MSAFEKFISIFRGITSNRWASFEEFLRVLYQKTSFIGPPIILCKSWVLKETSESLYESHVSVCTFNTCNGKNFMQIKNILSYKFIYCRIKILRYNTVSYSVIFYQIVWYNLLVISVVNLSVCLSSIFSMLWLSCELFQKGTAWLKNFLNLFFFKLLLMKIFCIIYYVINEDQITKRSFICLFPNFCHYKRWHDVIIIYILCHIINIYLLIIDNIKICCIDT